MLSQLNTPLWQACRQARRRQRLVGKISAFLLAVALLGLMDGLLAEMRTGSNQVDLLPGEAISLSGPSALKNPLDSDVLIRFKPENAPLHFNLEGFFTGYWFGNGMWRGGVQAEPQAEPGSYELRVSFKGAAGQAEQPFVLVVWADEAAQRAGSPSYIRRIADWNPFILAAWSGALGIVCGVGTYLLGRRYLRLLTELGCSEIFRVSRNSPPVSGAWPQGQKRPTQATCVWFWTLTGGPWAKPVRKNCTRAFWNWFCWRRHPCSSAAWSACGPPLIPFLPPSRCLKRTRAPEAIPPARSCRLSGHRLCCKRSVRPIPGRG